uniref:Uncharacterized protein n=1 Tax=Hemiselmis tepida TaxID=464990 RepID=A0A7S0VIA9_9CRYP|mmetsp:Transcript_17759/g.44732  ORF Transcript_17759/g.44732 Transcript_17759/m.44732 type:complete len:977 (+) Transcript_17759:180-3110(+)
MPRKKKDDRPESPDPATLELKAEPPADDAYEGFESEIPAYLLAKVDGDELQHLLDSEAGTPFDTPRDDRPETGASGNPNEEELAALAYRNRNQPKPILVQPDGLPATGPGPVDVEDVDANALGKFRESTKVMRGELEADELLRGDWQNVDGREWTVAHAKLLYLIWCHAQASSHLDQDDSWLRHAHLVVFIHEAVTSGILAYSTVPSSMPVTVGGTTSKVWVMTAHAALAAVYEMCSVGLVNCIRMVTEDFAQAPAYQASLKGAEMVAKMPEELKSQVAQIVHGPFGFEDEALEVVVEGREFVLTTPGGFVRRSNIGEIGHVPFITSPYIPFCLRHSSTLLTDHSSRSYESALWESDVEDVRGEAIALGNVTVLLSEWVPLGANTIFTICEKLGANAFPHTHEHKGVAAVPFLEGGGGGLRNQSVLVDCLGSVSVNFQANLCAMDGGELPGVRRVEHFGLHVGVERGVVCGAQMESVMDRDWDDMCFEMLARVVVDLQTNSTSLLKDVLTHEQERLLSFLFDGHEAHRTKLAVFIIDQIEPKMEAAAYMDHDMYEAELSRAIGDIQLWRDLGTDKTDLLFVGEHGVIVAGPNSRKAERVYVDWLTLTAKGLFIRQLFARLSATSSRIEELHAMIAAAPEDPNSIDRARRRLREITGEMSLLGQMLRLCLGSLEHTTPVQRSKDQVGKDMFEGLRLNKLQEEVHRSVKDLEKVFDSSMCDLKTIQDNFNTEQRKILQGVYTEVSNSSDQLFRARANLKITHKGTVSLPSELPILVMTMSFSGMLGVEILKRLHTGVTVGYVTPRWFSSGIQPFSESSPATLFLLQLAFILLICYFGMWFLGRSGRRSGEMLRKRAVINRKIVDMKALIRFLEDAGCVTAQTSADRKGSMHSKIVTVSFTDKSFFRWFGDYPLVTLELDYMHMFVKSALLSWDYMGKRISRADPHALVCDMLVEAGAISKADPRNPKPRWLREPDEEY